MQILCSVVIFNNSQCAYCWIVNDAYCMTRGHDEMCVVCDMGIYNVRTSVGPYQLVCVVGDTRVYL